MSIADKLVTIAENETKVYEAGKKAEYDRFWDAFQDNGARTRYENAFYAVTRVAELFYPKYDIRPIYCSQMFRGTNGAAYGLPKYPLDFSQRLKDCGVVFDTSQAKDLNWLFGYACVTSLPIISFEGLSDEFDVTYVTHGTFGYCWDLKTIEKVIPSATIDFQSNTFIECWALENITFDSIGVNGLNLSWSTKITHDSLMSIINALKDYSTDTSGTTWAVTLGETNLAKLTDTEKAIATQKGWTLA